MIFVEYYDIISTEVHVFKNIEKAKRFVLNKKLNDVKKIIECELNYKTDQFFRLKNRLARDNSEKTKEEFKNLEIAIDDLKKDLNHIDSITNVLLFETEITNLFEKNRGNFTNRYELKEKKVIF